MYVGDVNAEAGSSAVVAQLAAAMFAAQPVACANCGAETGQGVALKRCARCKQARRVWCLCVSVCAVGKGGVGWRRGDRECALSRRVGLPACALA